MNAISTPRYAVRRLTVVVVVAAVGLVGACAAQTELAALDTQVPDSMPPEGPIEPYEPPTTQDRDSDVSASDTTSPSQSPDPTAPDPTAPDPTAPDPTAPDPSAPETTGAPPTAPPTTEPADTETPERLETGDEGPAVTALQTRLQELGFFLPVIDGNFGSLTEQAVLAFQKGAGLSRDGVAGPNTLAALETATPLQARESGDHIEIDLARQLMFLVKGEATYIFNTSTGATGTETPPGRFTITREIDGMRHAPLGQLWRPKYFNGGIALHGSNSIPGHAASHGCARLHNKAIDTIWDEGLAPIGTPVWVY